MALAKITDSGINGKTKAIDTQNKRYFKTIKTDQKRHSKITDLCSKRGSKVVEDCHKKISSVIYKDPINSMVIFKVPFKIRIRDVRILDQYSPNNPPPIGIAIVGFNNYIL